MGRTYGTLIKVMFMYNGLKPVVIISAEPMALQEND